MLQGSYSLPDLQENLSCLLAHRGIRIGSGFPQVWHSAGHEPITKFVSTLLTVIPHLREVLAIRRDFKVEDGIQAHRVFIPRQFLPIGIEHGQ